MDIIRSKRNNKLKSNISWLNGQFFLVLPFFLFLSLFFILSGSVSAEEEKELSLKQMLLTPGDLTKAHANIETKCEKCHVEFDKSNQTPLCLNCHEIIADDLKEKTGFHGRLNKQLSGDCKNCHTDHKGRNFDIRNLDQDNFDHDLANFKLNGAHSNLKCSTCHQNDLEISSSKEVKLPDGIKALPIDKAFRFKSFTCVSCHVDFHEEALGDKCESCHNETSWKKSQFDHSKTDFALDGSHKDLACNSCHINNTFEKIDTQCQSCHLSKEPHLGIFGQQCIDCHTTKQWPVKRYDHFKETGYKLVGAHLQNHGNKVACINCHSEKLKPVTQCIGCHQADDIHQGGNGEKCQSCHNQNSWKKTDFVHDVKNTGFALTGAHKKANCVSCHLPGEKRSIKRVINDIGLIRDCIDCHQADDPHFGKLGMQCGNCHGTDSWQKAAGFNHDFTTFPLTGSHQLQVCESCHLTSDFSDQSQQCSACHSQDDYHKKSLGSQCESCHDTSVWGHWKFDHQRQTKFSLNGAHQNLKCSLCHQPGIPDALKPASDCYSCHREDDIHNGGFGTDCQQCHSEDKFDDLAL